jgi:hypothetical protein
MTNQTGITRKWLSEIIRPARKYLWSDKRPATHKAIKLYQLTMYITDHGCPVNSNKKGLNINELLQCKYDQTL